MKNQQTTHHLEITKETPLKKLFSPGQLLNYLFILYAFLLPIARAGLSLGAAIMLVLWILEGDLKRKIDDIKKNRVLMILGIYVVYMVLTLLWSENRDAGIKEIANYFIYFPIAFFVYTSIKKEYIFYVLSAFLAGMFLSEIISYGIFFEIWHKKGVSPTDPTPFMHHIMYSIFMAFTALLLLNRLFLETFSMKEKLVLILFFLSVTGNLFLNGGRTGQLAFLLSLSILVFLHFKVTWKTVLLSMVSTTAIISLAYLLSPTFSKRVQSAANDITDIVQKKNFSSSWGTRMAFILAGIEVFKQHPILGVGAGSVNDALRKEAARLGPEISKGVHSQSHPHDQYLFTTLQGGIVALVLLISFFVLFIRHPSSNMEACYLSVVLSTVYLIGFIGDDLWFRQFPMSLFAFMTGLILAMKRLPDTSCTMGTE